MSTEKVAETGQNDKFKHRMLGFAVIIALIVLIAPFLVNQEEYTDFSERMSHVQPQEPPVAPMVEVLEVVDLMPQQPDLPELNEFPELPGVVELSVDVESTVPVVAEIAAEEMVTPESLAVTTTQETSQTWHIQLASFSQTKNAEQLLQRLQEAGFRAQTEASENSKGVLIARVVVGEGLGRDQAHALRDELETKFKLRGLLVRDVS